MSLHKRLSTYLTSAPADENTLFWFRSAIVLKLLLWQYIYAFATGGKSTALAVCLTPIAVHVVRSRKPQSWALLVFTMYALYKVIGAFPGTPNHFYVELVILVVLLLDSTASLGTDDGFSPVNLLKFLYLAMFVQTGLAKAVNGYWLDGEYVAVSAFGGPEWSLLGILQRAVIRGLDGLFWGNLPPLNPEPSFFGSTAVALPGWVAVYLSLFGVAVILLELLLPFAMSVTRFRAVVFPLFVMFQTAISFGAGIISFGFTGLACVLLFSTRPAIHYKLLYAAMFLAFGVCLVDVFSPGFIPFAWY